MTTKNKTKKLSIRRRMMILKQWDIYADQLARKYTSKQQALYTQLFWLSVGQGKKTCQISYSALSKRCNISDKTVSIAVKELLKKRHIERVKQGFKISTIFRVSTPLEIITPDKRSKRNLSR